MILAKILQLLLAGLGYLPLGFARFLGALSGQIAFLRNARSARFTRANLSAVYPENTATQIDALVKASLIETGKLAFEMPIIWQHDTVFLSKIVKKIHHEALIEDAMKQGSGLIILAPHLGNWEVLGKRLPHYGNLTNLYKPPKLKAFEMLINRSRERSGANLVPTTSRGVATLLKRLKAGDITGILPDQVPDAGGGKFATFFGVPAFTPTLIHGLLTRTGSKALVSFAKRVKGGFEIYFIEPDEKIYSDDQATSLLGLNESIERIVELAPTQYQWEYKRFKKPLPDGTRPVTYS